MSALNTIEGERMLQQVGGLLSSVGRVVRASHERWDGGSDPDGLAGEAIPVAARICAACDAFNAMTTDRRKALLLHVAVAKLRQNAGTQFAPEVVDALVARSGARDLGPGAHAGPAGHRAGARAPLGLRDDAPGRKR